MALDRSSSRARAHLLGSRGGSASTMTLGGGVVAALATGTVRRALRGRNGPRFAQRLSSCELLSKGAARAARLSPCGVPTPEPHFEGQMRGFFSILPAGTVELAQEVQRSWPELMATMADRSAVPLATPWSTGAPADHLEPEFTPATSAARTDAGTVTR